MFAYPALAIALVLGGAVSPVPEDVLLAATGLAIARGDLAAVPALLASIAGVIAGDALLLFSGAAAARGARFLGLRPGDRMRRWGEGALGRFGLAAIVLARFVPGLRGAVFFAAGASGAPRPRILAIDLAASAIHVPLLFALGALARG